MPADNTLPADLKDVVRASSLPAINRWCLQTCPATRAIAQMTDPNWNEQRLHLPIEVRDESYSNAQIRRVGVPLCGHGTLDRLPRRDLVETGPVPVPDVFGLGDLF